MAPLAALHPIVELPDFLASTGGQIDLIFSIIKGRIPEAADPNEHWLPGECASTSGRPHWMVCTSYVLPPACYFLLLTSYFLLPASHFLLPTSYLLLPTSYLLLPTLQASLPTTAAAPVLENATCVVDESGAEICTTPMPSFAGSDIRVRNLTCGWTPSMRWDRVIRARDVRTVPTVGLHGIVYQTPYVSSGFQPAGAVAEPHPYQYHDG